MSFEAVEIERIVAEVMERLLTSPAAAHSMEQASSQPAAAAQMSSASIVQPVVESTSSPGLQSPPVHVAEAVITADLLQSRLNGEKTVQVGARAVLTPSARDFFRTRNIQWTRAADGNASAGVTGRSTVTHWQAVISKANSQVEAVVKNLLSAGAAWETRLTGLPVEAARQGVSALCRGEAAGVVVFAEQPELVACLANRNSKLRAAAVWNAQQVAAAARHLGANLLAIDPVGKSFFELRTMLKAFMAGGTPRPPGNWE